MFDLYVYEVSPATMQESSRFVGSYPLLTVCEAVGRTASKKDGAQSAVHQPWRFRFECRPIEAPKLQKTSDVGITFKLTLSYTSQDKQDAAVLPQAFKSNYECVSAGLQLRRTYVEKMVSKDGAPIVSFKCDPVYFPVSPSRQQIKQKTIDRT
jgi:hypothetical protein